MTLTSSLRPMPGDGAASHRLGRPRHLVMCPPAFFEVSYAINPWMHPARPVDRDLAMRQWQELRELYVGLGHRVEDVAPVRGLPDLVFTANAGIVIGERALVSRFRHSMRPVRGPRPVRRRAT